VTGIGSLPFTDPDQAIDFIAEYSREIPFWPQLPQKSPNEGMILQPLGMFQEFVSHVPQKPFVQVSPQKGTAFIEKLLTDEATLIESHASGFFAFEKAFEQNRFPKAKAIKAQCVGPITLASLLVQGETPFMADPRTMQPLSRFLYRLAQWQINRLKKFGLPILFFIDEPGLIPEKVKYLHGFFEKIKALGVTTGLHCCRTIPYETLLQLKPDFYSFDADKELVPFCHDPSAKKFFEVGGRVAWGLIPTENNLKNLNVPEIASNWLAQAKELSDQNDLISSSLFTASCGLGLNSVESTQSSFELARRIVISLH